MPAALFQHRVARACIALAAATLPAAAGAVDYALSADGNAVVRITPAVALTSADFDAALVTAAYPGWTVVKAAAAAGGAIASTTYSAGWVGAGGGAKYEAGYTQTNAVAAGRQLHYLQVITTNVPANGAISPYIDPQPNDDALPFYWTTAEVGPRSTNKSVQFSDFSRRPQSGLATTNPINWNAKLFQVEYDGATSVTVRNGVSWGWNMKPATVGSAAGSFVSPTPTCPPATCSGIGTNSVQWGTGDPGSLSFAGAAFAPVVGSAFKLGTLTYHNGATAAGSELTGVGLDITMNFTNVAEANFVYRSRLSIVNTPNTDDPIASADYVTFMVGGFNIAFNVLEGATATADVMATLTPRLGIVPGGAVVDKDADVSADPWVGGFDVQLVGFANPSGGGFISVVPEPGGLTLAVLGLCVVALRSALARRSA